MQRLIVFFVLIVFLSAFSCKKKEMDLEPVYVLQKWVRSIEKLDYSAYSKCEAYPKSEGVFLEMYKDDFFTDLTIMKVDEADEENVRKDYKGNSYVTRKAYFEASAVKRGKGNTYQLVSGDAEFFKFLDGEKSQNGWLIANRTITRVVK